MFWGRKVTAETRQVSEPRGAERHAGERAQHLPAGHRASRGAQFPRIDLRGSTEERGPRTDLMEWRQATAKIG